MKKAFTMTEVLITIGIIGLVAAMTFPSLLFKYKKQEAEARIKRFYTTMAQAVKLSEIDNGPAFSWTKAARMADGDGNIVANPAGTKEFYNLYLAKYLKTLFIDETNGKLKLIFADGSTTTMSIGYCMDIQFDYNGDKGANTLGYDRFDFLLCTEEGYNAGLSRYKQIPFDAYFPANCKNNCSRTRLLEVCKSKAMYCSSLIMYDGWKISDDYPYKIK